MFSRNLLRVTEAGGGILMVVTGFAEATFADIVAHQSACQSLTLKLSLDNAYLLQGKNCQGYDNLQFNFRWNENPYLLFLQQSF